MLSMILDLSNMHRTDTVLKDKFGEFDRSLQIDVGICEE